MDVAWAAEVLLRFAVDESGRTAFERMIGHRVRHKVFALGDRIFFKSATDPGHRNKLDGEWLCGLFAGVASRSGEYLVIVGDQIFKAPIARALLEKQAYDGKVVQEMRASYFEYVRAGAASRIRTPARTIPSQLVTADPRRRDYAPRKMHLWTVDFEACRASRQAVQHAPGCKPGTGSGRTTPTAAAGWRMQSSTRKRGRTAPRYGPQ